MINKKILFCCSLVMMLISCDVDDKIVDIPMKDGSGKIVIEGEITNEEGPYEIRVSRSVKVTSNEEIPVVTNAKVILSDNHGQTEELVYDPNDESYKTKNFTTAEGDTYTLSVTVDGKVYQSTSTMNKLVEIEKLEQEKDKLDNSTFVSVFFTDPAEKGNKYVLKGQKGELGATQYNVYSDDQLNGGTIGYPLYGKFNLNKNDTVFVELQSVDTPVYNYFRVLSNLGLGDSGDIATPANPPSNISNGALGYFSAHSVSGDYIIIQ